MTAPDVITVDFETWPIEPRPHYPPRPCGVAIQWPNKLPHYWHQPQQAQEALSAVWASGLPILCHNAKFDLAVATEQLGFPMLPWQRIHDTTFLLFLHDPYARELALKAAAEAYLGEPPEEMNELHAWIWEHRAELQAAYPQYGNVKKSQLGAWIFAAPLELVAPYACGDCHRTTGLFKHLWPKVQAAGMGGAYGRERKLLPILMENERVGIRCNVAELSRDVEVYRAAFQHVETALRCRLGAPDLNFDADQDVAAALDRLGLVTQWGSTPSGLKSMKKDVLLPEHFTDPQVASALGYRNRLATCLKMFMEPWLAQAVARGGYISTNWNQVAGMEGGTRTGRPSTRDPNFLNISKNFEGRSDGYVHPDFLNVPVLPLVRRYLLPDDGHTWLKRDQSSQEVRVFAHFECGTMAAAYRANPKLDPHSWLKEEIVKATGVELERTRVKNVTFSRLYGGGKGAVYRQARCKSEAEAAQIMAYHDKALPGRVMLDEEIKRLARSGKPIRTWGGRLYYLETPRVVDGRLQTYDYRLINYLCQGSAADLTKQNIIDFVAASADHTARWLVQVYDEISISSPIEDVRHNMLMLREIMETPLLDVPLLTDGSAGPAWGKLEKYDD